MKDLGYNNRNGSGQCFRTNPILTDSNIRGIEMAKPILSNPSQDSKKCTKCDEVKPLIDFPFRKDRGKYLAACKECRAVEHRQWRESHAEEYQQYHAQYRERHRQKAREVSRQWRNSNPVRMRLAVNAWRRANPQKRREEFQRYYAKHSEKVKACSIRSAVKRRSNLQNVRCDFTADQWAEMKRRYKYRCYYCGEKKPLTQDHVIPISRGGEHTWLNILPACQSCNSRKQDKSVEEFLGNL